MILALYGNFRQGEPLSHYLEPLFDAGHTETVILKGLKMFALGQAPGVKITNKEEDEIVVELLQVDLSPSQENAWMRLLDKIEGVGSGLYERSMITTPLGTAYIYTCKLITRGLPVIKDWLEWKSRSKEETMKAFHKTNKNAVLIGLRS